MKKIIKALYPNGNVVDDWSSIKEAADYTGFNISNIRKSIKSGKLYHGFYWKNEEVQEVIKQKKVKKAKFIVPLFVVSQEGEEWRNIEGYDSYLISNKGRVMSKNYRGTGKRKILSPYYTSQNRNYLQIKLKNNKGKLDSLFIHRLVAEAFIPNPQDKKEIDHIDTNPENNNVENLRWVTHTENMNNPITKEKILNHLNILNGKN